MQTLSALSGYVLLFFVPVLGALLLVCHRLLVRPGTAILAGKLRLMMAVWAGGVTLLGAAGVAGTAAAARTVYEKSELNMADVLGCAVAGLLSIVFLSCGQAVFWVRRAVSREGVDRESDLSSRNMLDERVAVLSGIGWLFVLLPMVYFGPLVVTGLIVPVCLLAIVLLYMTVRKRGHEAHLLWVLAIAAENRLPIPDELFAYAATLRGRRRLQTEQLANRIRSGIPLSQALDEAGVLVPRSAVLAARVAEPLGTLAATLRDAAVRQTSAIQRSAEASSVAWFLLHYSVVISVLVTLMALHTMWVVPEVLKTFEAFGADFPGYSTHTVRTIDSAVKNAPLLMPLAAVPAAVLAVLGVGHYRGWENLKLPILGRFFLRADTPWILRNLARAVSACQTLSDGLLPMASYHHRFDVGRRLSRVAQRVAQGERCWVALRTERFINSREQILLSTAERAGNLPWVLGELADEIERRRGKWLLAAFEVVRPILVFMIGLSVASVCVAWFLPVVRLIEGQLFPQ